MVVSKNNLLRNLKTQKWFAYYTEYFITYKKLCKLICKKLALNNFLSMNTLVKNSALLLSKVQETTIRCLHQQKVTTVLILLKKSTLKLLPD